MKSENDGLVSQHVRNIQKIAKKAETGIDISKELLDAVNEALDQFLRVKDGNPASILASFIGQLRMAAELTSQPQPIYSATLLGAAKEAARASVDHK